MFEYNCPKINQEVCCVNNDGMFLGDKKNNNNNNNTYTRHTTQTPTHACKLPPIHTHTPTYTVTTFNVDKN